MHIPRWIPKATNTQSEYVILIAFPLHKSLRERASLLLYTCTACLITLRYIKCFSVASLLLTQYCAGGKIENNEMGGACGAYGGGERCAQGSGGET